MFNQQFPFRFAFNIDMAVKNDWMSLDIKLPLYSDSKFRSHFMNREEGLKWAQFLNTNDEESVVEENEITSLDWILAGTLTPSFESLSPVVENISLNKINISFNWRSAVLDYPDQGVLDTNNYTLEDSLSFFYPTSLISPDISGSISGTIFKSPEINAGEITEQLSIEEYELLKDPWSVENIDLPLSDSDLLIDPELMEYIPIEISSGNSFFINKLNYSISPSIVLNTIFSSDVPGSPDEINFKPDYSIFSTQTTSLLDYSFNINDSLLTVNNILNFSMNYKLHLNPDEIEASVWDSYEDQDENATNYKVTNNVKVISKPFIKNKDLSESTFTYNLGAILYNRYYDNDPSAKYFIDDYFRWNKNGISSHSADMELKYYDSNNYQILKLDTILPPKNPELYPEIILSSDHFTGSLKTGFIYGEPLSENSWSVDPYEGYIKYSFFDKDYLKQTVSIDTEEPINNFAGTELFIDKMESNITFKQKFDINLYEGGLQKSYTDLNLWFFNFNFLAEDTKGYHFVTVDELTVDEPSAGWYQDSNNRLQPSQASAGVNYSYKPDPFWKNRIRLSLDINSSWTMNLLKYTDTVLSFNPKFTLYIAEFLDLSVESSSVNRAMYRYIPSFANGVGVPSENLIDDLLDSFNFFNRDDRVNSNFNIESISLSATHHLSDWDLNFKYTGLLDLIAEGVTKKYQWKSEFSIFVIWKPVPEIKKNISYSENEIDFK